MRMVALVETGQSVPTSDQSGLSLPMMNAVTSLATRWGCSQSTRWPVPSYTTIWLSSIAAQQLSGLADRQDVLLAAPQDQRANPYPAAIDRGDCSDQTIDTRQPRMSGDAERRPHLVLEKGARYRTVQRERTLEGVHVCSCHRVVERGQRLTERRRQGALEVARRADQRHASHPGRMFKSEMLGQIPTAGGPDQPTGIDLQSVEQRGHVRGSVQEGVSVSGLGTLPHSTLVGHNEVHRVGKQRQETVEGPMGLSPCVEQKHRHAFAVLMDGQLHARGEGDASHPPSLGLAHRVVHAPTRGTRDPLARRSFPHTDECVRLLPRIHRPAPDQPVTTKNAFQRSKGTHDDDNPPDHHEPLPGGAA